MWPVNDRGQIKKGSVTYTKLKFGAVTLPFLFIFGADPRSSLVAPGHSPVAHGQ